MKKILLIVVPALLVAVVVVAGGSAYVGYRFIKTMAQSSCAGSCISEHHGGTMIHGSGKLTTEARNVQKFTAVRLASAGDVTIERTGTESVSVTAEDNLLPFFTSEVKDGTLYLSVARDKSFEGKAPKYRITVVALRAIEVEGAGDVTAGKLDGDALSVSDSGSGDVRLEGRVGELTLSLSGSGDADAAALQAKHAQVTVSGSGDVTVNATDTLGIDISGSGDVTYLGSPKLTKSISGSGSISHKPS